MNETHESKRNVLLEKSMDFSIKMVKVYQNLCAKREYVLSKQVLRSATSIGANVREAKRGQSKPDFLSKLSIALKEADETEYWLELLNKTNYIDDSIFDEVYSDCEELVKLLTAITKTLKSQIANSVKRVA